MGQAKGFFQWKEGFNVGIDEIDKQHQSFLELLNKCHESHSGSIKDVTPEDTIEKLKTYIATHFRHEEQLLESIGYEGLDWQLKQHKYFESLVDELEIAHMEGDVIKVKSTLSLLRDWFLHHILEEDMKYAPYLKQSR